MDLAIETSAAAVGKLGYFDLVLGPTGDLQLTSGPAAIGQAIHQRLFSFTEDFFLSLAEGCLSPSVISSRQGLTPGLEAILQSTIVETPGVVSLLSWSAKLDPVTRRLSVAFEAQVTGGVVVFNAPIDLTGAA